ncbi:MAG: hypothetical protein LBI29_03730 [Rickettsiales bacterium]|jgi:hypothetical protein|nr:hypothetical protein [Rickettsiales bacterium]
MKKLFLVTVVALALGAEISFATGTKVNCVSYTRKYGKRTELGYGTTEIEEPSYYLEDAVDVDDIKNVVICANNSAKKMNSAEKWLDDNGVYMIIAAVMQSRGDESSDLMKAVLMVRDAGYKPVGRLIEVAKELLRTNGRKK